MAHIDDLFEQQTKQLLHQLCDALGIEQQDRTKSGLEKAIAGLKKPAFVGMDIAKDESWSVVQCGKCGRNTWGDDCDYCAKEAEIERH